MQFLKIIRKQDCKAYWKTHPPSCIGLATLTTCTARFRILHFNESASFFLLAGVTQNTLNPSSKVQKSKFIIWLCFFCLDLLQSCEVGPSKTSWKINICFCAVQKYKSQNYAFNFVAACRASLKCSELYTNIFIYFFHKSGLTMMKKLMKPGKSGWYQEEKWKIHSMGFPYFMPLEVFLNLI